MTTYKDIILSYNDEEFRLNRLKSVVDYLDELKNQTLDKIFEIEDDKGILNIYYGIRLTTYEKLYIKHIWHEENENIVKFIKYIERIDSPTFCPYCSEVPKPKEDNDNEFEYIDFNTNI